MKKMTSIEFFETILEMTELSQTELASAIGWQKQRISAYLTGKNDPNMRRVQEVCDVALRLGIKRNALCRLLEDLFVGKS